MPQGIVSLVRRQLGAAQLRRGRFATGQRAQTPQRRAKTSASSSPSAYQSQSTKNKKPSKLLASLLSLSTLPLTSYVPFPKTLLHRISPTIKLAYILVFLVFISKTSSIATKFSISAFFVLLQVATFPPRLWKPQLVRTLAVSGFVLFCTACGSDGVAPVLSGGRNVEASSIVSGAEMANVPTYSYTLLNLGFMSVTKRSWALATTLFSLTSMTLTAASIILLTTQPEKLAMSLKHLLFPLRILGVQTHTLFLMTVVSLRFISVVFEEMRHLLLGVASRGIDFGSLGGLGVLNIVIKAGNELFRRLFERAERVSRAMAARGVTDVTKHKVLVDDHIGRTGVEVKGVVANAVAVGVLVGLTASISIGKV